MLRLIAIVTMLIACAPSPRNIRTYDATTQIWQTMSRDAEVFRDDKDHVLARTIILERHGTAKYYLSISVLRSKAARPVILALHSDGIELDYTRYDQVKTFCIDHCHQADIGTITLSKSAFLAAAHRGMRIEITGKNRTYPTTIPARIFRNAIAQTQLLAH